VTASAAVIAAVVYFPPTQEAFATVALGAWQVAVVTALSLVPVLLVEAAKAGRRHGRPGLPATPPVPTAHPRGLSA
jgi:hypothetical protein